MAVEVLTRPRIWMGPYDVSGDLSGAALKHGRDQKEGQTFGMVGKARKGGLYETTAEHHGFWSSGGPGDAMFSQIGLVNVPITIAPGSVNQGADGEMAYSFPASHASYELGETMGNLQAFTVKAEAAGDRLVRGTLMHSSNDASGAAVVRTTSGTGVIRQLGAVAAGQSLWIGSHVIAVGTGTLTITVKSAAAVGFSSPTTRYTSSVYSAIGNDWASVPGAITDQYWRVEWTIGGGAPAFQFTVNLAIL